MTIQAQCACRIIHAEEERVRMIMRVMACCAFDSTAYIRGLIFKQGERRRADIGYADRSSLRRRFHTTVLRRQSDAIDEVQRMGP